MPAPATDTKIVGVLERIVFFREGDQSQDPFFIARLRAKDHKELVTVKGNLGQSQCGETLNLNGYWKSDKEYGEQFVVRTFISELPSSVYGIRKYLGSGLVKGVSKGIAERIVKKFGQDTLRVISEESARLQEVSGIGKQRALAIKEAWEEQACLREVLMFLQTYGVSTSQCLRIIKHFGPAAITVLKNEPYRVAREIHGIGFKTADRIAINMGIPNDSPQRIDAGLLFALEELQDDGHTAYPAKELVDYSTEALETDRAFVRNGLKRLFENKAVFRIDAPDGTIISQLPQNKFAEEKIAQSVERIQNAPSILPPIKREAAVQWAQEKAGFEFADAQASAIVNALANKAFILTGGPGTGKTTILRALVSVLKAKKARVLLAAPTGRAAQRLAETTGGYAQTIHRLLKYDPNQSSFTVNESKPLSADVVIVDETSMLDTRLAASLFQAVPAKAHLVLVGDTDQLPSVGAGNVLKDLISSDTIPFTRLDVVFRQGKHSAIVRFAHSINKGEVAYPKQAASIDELDTRSDFQFVNAEDQEDCARKTVEICKAFIERRTEYHPIHDTQILAPMHKGIAGVGNLNRLLQQELNDSQASMSFGAGLFKVGDKVLQTRNNYDKGVFNGDIGKIEALDGASGVIDVNFDGNEVSYDKSEMLDLSLAYAVSIHKSQGSEYPVVIVPLLKAHFMMLQRNLIYTAITRGKRKVIIVGDPAAYAMAVRNSDSKSRCTYLKELLLNKQ